MNFKLVFSLFSRFFCFVFIIKIFMIWFLIFFLRKKSLKHFNKWFFQELGTCIWTLWIRLPPKIFLSKISDISGRFFKIKLFKTSPNLSVSNNKNPFKIHPKFLNFQFQSTRRTRRTSKQFWLIATHLWVFDKFE